MTGGLPARLDRHLVPVVRRRTWKRLDAAIAAYRQEIAGRSRVSDKAQSSTLDAAPMAATSKAIDDALASAEESLRDGNIDKGWRHLLAAQRLELLLLGDDARKAAAVALRKEAEAKLSGWRAAAVSELLPTKDASVPVANIVMAAALRDEHSANEAYKDGLRRSSALRLAAVLAVVLATLLWLACAGYLSWAAAPIASGASLFHQLLGIAVFGLLGATISAITDVPKSTGTRIPEMVSTIRVTLLRLLAGPASAIIVYFFARSSLFSSDASDSYLILVMAFAAGFTERVVMRVVESVAAKT